MRRKIVVPGNSSTTRFAIERVKKGPHAIEAPNPIPVVCPADSIDSCDLTDPVGAAAHDDSGTQPALAAAIAGPQRSEANKARDKYRHPLETLTFFGIKPEMTVVEISPGAGWYTEILAPLLKDHGKLYEAVGGGAGAKTFEDKLKADPAVYGQVIVTTLKPPAETDIARPGAADMVLTFRNVHNWLAHGNTEDYFKAFYRALKPGGSWE